MSGDEMKYFQAELLEEGWEKDAYWDTYGKRGEVAKRENRRRLCKWRIWFFILPAVWQGVDPFAVGAQTYDSRESKIKAGFLFNFAKFVEWPESDPKSTTDTITIGILGKDPIGDYLEDAVQGKEVQGKKVAVRKFEDRTSLTPCHILYIADSARDDIDEVLGILREASTLTVGADEGAFDQGCHIGFVIKENKVKFIVNKESAERAGLKFSSKILSVAEKVIG
jgi:hypothetical protein